MIENQNVSLEFSQIQNQLRFYKNDLKSEMNSLQTLLKDVNELNVRKISFEEDLIKNYGFKKEIYSPKLEEIMNSISSEKEEKIQIIDEISTNIKLKHLLITSIEKILNRSPNNNLKKTGIVIRHKED